MKMPETKSISVIVCAYNSGKTICKCLESLSRQRNIDPEKYEIIIIDDGSEDRTAELVKVFLNKNQNQLTEIRYVKVRHGGLSISRNTGMLLARAPVIAYIDHDAVADAYWVAELLKAWESHPNADSIGGCIPVLNQENYLAKLLYDATYSKADKWAIIGTNMSFQRQRIMRTGGFCDLFVYRGDETYLFRKIGENAELVKWPQAIVYHKCPDNLLRWFRERNDNGRLLVLIESLCEPKEIGILEKAIKNLTKIFLVLFMFIVFAWKWPILCVVEIIWLLVRMVQSQVWQDIFYLRRKKHGIIQSLIDGCAAAIIMGCGDFFFNLGITNSYLKLYIKNAKKHIPLKCSMTKEYIIEELAAGGLK